jgi:hypothetical protein
MRGVRDVMRSVYEKYFVNGQVKGDSILKKLFKFLKDFELSPYLLNTKASFMIYYFTCESECRPDEP